jgi:hypothetical protein
MSLKENNRLARINGCPDLNDIKILMELSSALKKANREGNEEDDPEGTRYIMISDRLATKMSEKLKEIAEKILIQLKGDL